MLYTTCMSAEHREHHRFPLNIMALLERLAHKGKRPVAERSEEPQLAFPRREIPSVDDQTLITMIIENATKTHVVDRGVVWIAASDWRAVFTRHTEIPNIDRNAHDWIENFHRRLKEDKDTAFIRPSVFRSVDVFRSTEGHLALIVGQVGEYVPLLAPLEPFHGAELNMLFEHLFAKRVIDLSRHTAQGQRDIKQILEGNFAFLNHYFQLGLVLEPVDNYPGAHKLMTPAQIRTADPVI